MSVAPAVECAFLGSALHAPARGRLELLRNVAMSIDAAGTIRALHAADSADGAALVARHRGAGTLREAGAGQYLLPGMIDLHVHAPQWPQLGLALDQPLEVWLQQHTFPLEARYADLAFAERVYESLVDGLLANGTTTAMYYASIHLPATQRLADICLRRSQRALIGRVAMDHPEECPSFYRDSSAAAAEADTRALIAYVQSLPGNAAALVQPVITPRFIPACSDELLRRLGALRRETGCYVQTHCSESDWEHGHVLQRCGVTDTAALESFGLLSRRTILGHGNFIAGDDVGRILAAGSAIAHCPLSNVYFSDAIFPLRRLLERKVHVGLGTDIAGGASASIIDNARHAVIASRTLECGVDPAEARALRRRESSRIDAPTAFWLATAAGGIALGLPLGLFRPGFQFDAILIDADAPGSNLRLDPGDAPHDVVQKIIYGASRTNVREVWVAGRSVHAAGQRAGAPLPA
jgi:guanine deaminase